MREDGARPKTIHRRFGMALLHEALAGAGRVHLDFRIDREPETIHVWEPRRSANDPAPPMPPDPDPAERLGQAVLTAAAERAGIVQAPVEIGGEPDWIDLYFEPSAAGAPAPGLLGRITAAPCLLSPQHLTPTADDVRHDLFHSHSLWSARDRPDDDLVAIWQLCTDAASTIVESFGLHPKEGWPLGVYTGPPALAVNLVVLSELPATRDTLLLRLLGTGAVLTKALEEQAALPDDALERRATQAALRAVAPAGEPIPLVRAPDDAVLRACRKTYRRWAQR